MNNSDKFVKLDSLEKTRKIVSKMPKVEILGRRELKIENHKGIIVFDNDKVKINTKLGVLNINGNNFNILFMGGETLVIEGDFKSLNYEGEV